MNPIPQYNFYKTKYGDELLIDVVELKYIKKYVQKKPVHTLTYYDITLITEGKGGFNIDDQKHSVQAKDIIFSRPGEIRRWDKENIENGYALIFEEEFLISFFNDTYFIQNLSYFNPKRNCCKLSLNEDLYAHIIDLIQRIQKEIHEYQTKDKHILRAILYEVLMLLERAYKEAMQSDDLLSRQTNQHINDFIQLVDKHFKLNRSIQFYADQLCISSNYLNELTKKIIGINAKQYIQNKVVLEAKRLLNYTTYSVSEIAYSLNYNNPSYFIRFFHNQAGITPSEYRKITKP